MECEAEDEFFYLSPGDLAMARRDGTKQASYFPLSHYHGITIRIHIDHAPRCLSCILDDVHVHPSHLLQKFCISDHCHVVRSHSGIEHIFSELYSVPESIRKGYFKVKILELLLFLSGMDIAQQTIGCLSYTKSQAILAKNISQYLTKHMDARITLEQLSERFHTSGTQIKNSFKRVYGVSFYSYIRTQKMQSAAFMLRRTDCTILEVAGRFGYDNASKFARAFKDVMGLSPNKYRNVDGELLLQSRHISS